jgi:hypothetical protein
MLLRVLFSHFLFRKWINLAFVFLWLIFDYCPICFLFSILGIHLSGAYFCSSKTTMPVVGLSSLVHHSKKYLMVYRVFCFIYLFTTLTKFVLRFVSLDNISTRLLTTMMWLSSCKELASCPCLKLFSRLLDDMIECFNEDVSKMTI